MSLEHSRNQENDAQRIILVTRLLSQAADGHLDNLECPKCRQQSVFVWFTHPAVDTYRTWFICVDCDFHTRAQNAERPSYFSEERVSGDLEERDLLALKQSLFKRPPHQIM